MSEKRGTILAPLELGKSKASDAEPANARGRTSQDSKLNTSTFSKSIVLPSLPMAGKNVSRSQTTIKTRNESPVKFW